MWVSYISRNILAELKEVEVCLGFHQLMINIEMWMIGHNARRRIRVGQGSRWVWRKYNLAHFSGKYQTSLSFWNEAFSFFVQRVWIYLSSPMLETLRWGCPLQWHRPSISHMKAMKEVTGLKCYKEKLTNFGSWRQLDANPGVNLVPNFKGPLDKSLHFET